MIKIVRRRRRSLNIILGRYSDDEHDDGDGYDQEELFNEGCVAATSSLSVCLSVLYYSLYLYASLCVS